MTTIWIKYLPFLYNYSIWDVKWSRAWNLDDVLERYLVIKRSNYVLHSVSRYTQVIFLFCPRWIYINLFSRRSSFRIAHASACVAVFYLDECHSRSGKLRLFYNSCICKCIRIPMGRNNVWYTPQSVNPTKSKRINVFRVFSVIGVSNYVYGSARVMVMFGSLRRYGCGVVSLILTTLNLGSVGRAIR